MSEKELERPRRLKETAKDELPKTIPINSSEEPILNLPAFPKVSIPTEKKVVEKVPGIASLNTKEKAAPDIASFNSFPTPNQAPSIDKGFNSFDELQTYIQQETVTEIKVAPNIVTFGTMGAKTKPSEIYSQPVLQPTMVVQNQYESLAPLEREVLDIAENILKKKKFESTISLERVETMSPLMEELLAKCIAKLTHTKGFSKEEIFRTIQTLEKNYWIVTEQRRTKEEIVQNPILQNVLQFIHMHPGTHARDPAIEKELGISRNPFIKHVSILEAFGLIRSKRIGKTQNYFSATIPEIFDDFVVLFSNELVPRIIQYLLDDPTISLSELARRLDVYHGAIQYHLKALNEMNLLIRTDSGLQINRELLKRYNQLYKIPPFRF